MPAAAPAVQLEIGRTRASLPDRRSLAPGDPPYTRPMRRFVCVAALLFGFSGDRYAWMARPRSPVPVVQPVRLREQGGTLRDPAWWRT